MNVGELGAGNGCDSFARRTDQALIVTLRHLRRVPSFSGRHGFCSHGSREWFAYHGLDWGAFVREGIEAEVIEATGDALGLHLVAFARTEAAGG